VLWARAVVVKIKDDIPVTANALPNFSIVTYKNNKRHSMQRYLKAVNSDLNLPGNCQNRSTFLDQLENFLKLLQNSRILQRRILAKIFVKKIPVA